MLVKRVRTGRVKQRCNWVVVQSRGGKGRKCAVVGFPYRTESRQERNGMMEQIAEELVKDAWVFGVVIIGVDVDVGTRPYDVLVYVPGRGPGAPDVDGVLRRSVSS